MLTEKQIFEIKEHLDKAVNPIFFFDNDADGLCSFLLLARAYKKGKGIAIKSFPELNESYARKLTELNSDYVFILDKPVVSQAFFDEARKLNLPIVWIDHHDTDSKIPEYVSYYNPSKEGNGNEPVTYLAWQLTERKEDLWLAVAGCIGDCYMPAFSKEFAEEYSEMWGEAKTPFQALYETDIGKVSRILNFALKDRTSNVIKMIRFLIKVSSAREILDDNEKNYVLFRFKQVDSKYQKLIEKARSFSKGKIIYFQYGGNLSLSGDIANELSYRFPGKIIVVAYIQGTRANVSLRGKDIKEITLKAIEGLENATGGGHKDATGAKVNLEDLPKFKERIENFSSKI